jgi:hypothetical protein
MIQVIERQFVADVVAVRISRRAFPADCPWSQAELRDPDFLPGE